MYIFIDYNVLWLVIDENIYCKQKLFILQPEMLISLNDALCYNPYPISIAKRGWISIPEISSDLNKKIFYLKLLAFYKAWLKKEKHYYTGAGVSPEKPSNIFRFFKLARFSFK